MLKSHIIYDYCGSLALQVEYFMEPILILIMLFCITGATYTSWKSGHTAGIHNTLAYLESEGLIELESEEI